MTNTYRVHSATSTHNIAIAGAPHAPGIGATPYRHVDPSTIQPRSPVGRVRYDPSAMHCGLDDPDFTDEEIAGAIARVDPLGEMSAGDLASAVWRDLCPIGCKLARTAYQHSFRKATLYTPRGHRPGMYLAIKFCVESWPKVARIVVYSGNTPLYNYRRTRADDEDGYAYDFDGGRCWKELRADRDDPDFIF